MRNEDKKKLVSQGWKIIGEKFAQKKVKDHTFLILTKVGDRLWNLTTMHCSQTAHLTEAYLSDCLEKAELLLS
jgi:hypothetical protein